MKNHYAVLLILLSLGFTGALAQDSDERDDGFISKWANKWDGKSEAELKAVGLISEINSQTYRSLPGKIASIASLISQNPDLSFKLERSEPYSHPRDPERKIILQYVQVYKGYPVYGGHARIDLSIESRIKKGSWEVISYNYTIANLNTAVPTLLSEPELLQSAENYMKENYVLGNAPKFADEDKKPVKPSLTFQWKIEYHYQRCGNDEFPSQEVPEHTWRLGCVTNHNYWIEMEKGHWPLPMGLWLDAHDGKVIEEDLRAAVGCFGPAPTPKKPNKTTK